MSQNLLADYRKILRHFSKLPTFQFKTTSDGSLRKHVIQQFRDGKAETDKAKINYMRRLAHEYAVMVSDIREAKHLRYLDTGEKLDPREKIELTARRVGLTVPQVRSQMLEAVACTPIYRAAIYWHSIHSIWTTRNNKPSEMMQGTQ